MKEPRLFVQWGGGGNPEPDAALLAHCFNTLPEVVQLAQDVADAYGCECIPQGPKNHCPMCLLRAALAKANTVKIPQPEKT